MKKIVVARFEYQALSWYSSGPACPALAPAKCMHEVCPVNVEVCGAMLGEAIASKNQPPRLRCYIIHKNAIFKFDASSNRENIFIGHKSKARVIREYLFELSRIFF